MVRLVYKNTQSALVDAGYRWTSRPLDLNVVVPIIA